MVLRDKKNLAGHYYSKHNILDYKKYLKRGASWHQTRSSWSQYPTFLHIYRYADNFLADMTMMPLLLLLALSCSLAQQDGAMEGSKAAGARAHINNPTP